VLRGGSWNNNHTDNFRCDYRNRNNPHNRNNNRGFRCCAYLARSQPECGAFTDAPCVLWARAPDVPAHTSGQIHKSAVGSGRKRTIRRRTPNKKRPAFRKAFCLLHSLV